MRSGLVREAADQDCAASEMPQDRGPDVIGEHVHLSRGDPSDLNTRIEIPERPLDLFRVLPGREDPQRLPGRAAHAELERAVRPVVPVATGTPSAG